MDDAIKELFHQTSIHKNLVLRFPGSVLPDLDNGSIYQESMKLTESICDGENIEFVGCISSKFQVKIANVSDVVKGQRLTAALQVEGYEIPLFDGIIDSAKMQSNKRYKEITAYDTLYENGKIDISNWYNGLAFPISLKQLRDSLFSYIGIVQEEITLPNDAMLIEKKYDPKQLTALTIVKAICQINGSFGVMREGIFRYLYLEKEKTNLYPAATLYPSAQLFPVNPTQGGSIKETETIGVYKAVYHEDYVVKPVEKITIRENSDSAGVSYGNGSNHYIIQGNVLTHGKTTAELYEAAGKIFEKIHGISYIPFTSENIGLPYIHCGDMVSFYTLDGGVISCYVLNRELKGIQALMDSYGAEGEEYLTEIVSDLQDQIDEIRQTIPDAVDRYVDSPDFSDKLYGYMDDYWQEHGGGGGLLVESVHELPAVPDPRTIYLVQGEVTIT